MTGFPRESDTSATAQVSTTRGNTARMLLSRRQVRDSIALAPQPQVRISFLAGLQAALTGLIALPLIYISPWSQLIGFASLGTLVALFGRFAPEARRSGILARCAFLQVFAVFVVSFAAWLRVPLEYQMLLLALSCGLFFFVSTTGRFGAPGPLIFVFAASASMGNVASLQLVMQRTAATAVTALLAWCICWVTERFRRNPRPDIPLPVEPVRPLSHRLVATARITVGAAIATFSAYLVGAAYPGWAAMGALAVMQGVHLHVTMSRALQRMAGTVVGSILVGLVLAQAPSVWLVIAMLTFLVIATEVVIGANYAFGQVLVTPMALLMTYLASSQKVGASIASERIMDTLLGAAIGILFAVLWSTLDDRVHLAHHHNSSLT